MASVVFNSFKQRYLNGEVPNEDVWTFVPVNKNFNETFAQNDPDFKLEQYRSLNDFFSHNTSAMQSSYFQGIKTDYDWYKLLDTSATDKPMFITSGVYDDAGNKISASNWDEFKKTNFYADVSGNADIKSYLASGGFYYILKKEELRWFGDRVNNGNNRIIGVLGDGIEGVIRGQIGKSDEYAFQGILDGNGHSLENATIICDNEDNGLVGVLGSEGVVKNFRIINDENFINNEDNISLKCEKTIDINHLKKSGRDVNAGMLVGRNYGQVSNINAQELSEFRFSGFVPQIYSVTNKADNYSDFSTIREKYDDGENLYFLNSWCINSPGNICPYVGYFAEGLFAQSARGFDASGNVDSIETYPTLKSKYNTGICDVTLDLSSKIDNIAFFVKATNTVPGIYTGDKQQYLHVSRYCQNADKQWGTNCVMFLGYKTKNNLGKDTEYYLEINGTAFDKKSGTGKRRYYFHAGHYNYKKNLKYLTQGSEFTAAEWNEKPSDDNISLFYYYLLGPDKSFAIKGVAKFSNGSDETFNENDTDNDAFEVSDGDIKVYSKDGLPVKVVSVDATSMYWKPRNLDVSSAVWKDITFNLKIKQGTYYYSGTIKDNTEAESSDRTWLFVFNVAEENPNVTEYVNEDSENKQTLGLNEALDFAGYTTPGCWTGTYTNKGQWYYYDGAISKEEAITKLANADLGIPVPLNAELRNDLWKQAAMKIANDACQESSEMFHWVYGQADGGPVHYASKIIVDNTDKSNLNEYLKNRENEWQDGTTFDGLHAYDILVNKDDGIQASGTISFSMLQIGDFQYRPFVHASESDNLTYVDENVTSSFTANNSIFPGAKFGDVSANEGSAFALNYFTSAANKFIQNPNYYGLDNQGYWTTNCVRPYPGNSTLANSAEINDWRNLSSNRESWISTLNFNWNIMRHMFETEAKHVNSFAQYDDVNDPEPYRYDTHIDTVSTPQMTYEGFKTHNQDSIYSDVPHAILNKPLKMNNMVRAAYYISPIVGANFGKIEHVIVSSDRTNKGNFVGFLGSIAGKQERGIVNDCSVYAKDKFNYFETYPIKPNSADYDASSYSAAMNKYYSDCKTYNYQVRYKQTPILPNSVTESIDTISEDPDLHWNNYEFYPMGSESKIDPKISADFISAANYSGLKAYLDELGVTMFTSAADNPDMSAYFETYQNNSDYVYDKTFFVASSPVRAFTSAWYDDYDTTGKDVMDDVVTYKLRPIINAGGMFGKVIPAFNNSTLGLTSTSVANYTTFEKCNVCYELDDVSETAISSIAELSAYSQDIHNTFGSIAGMLEVQTSNLGQVRKGINNSITLNSLNISSKANSQADVLPFGFMTYQPNEIPSVATSEGSSRHKGGVHVGEYTNTTYAIDLPIVINSPYLSNSRNDFNFAPINHSSAAFYQFDKDDFASNKHLSGDATKPYFQKILDSLFYTNGDVNINTSDLTYCNVSSLDIFSGTRGPECLDSLFGSYTTFIPSMPMTERASAEKEYVKEQLENPVNTRTYVVGHTPLSATQSLDGKCSFKTSADSVPITDECLSNLDIFNKQENDDIYFSYTYSSTSSFMNDWSFKHNVKFTIATASGNNETMGYVFHDELDHDGDGFKYNNNYLHIGNSVSPKHIRTQLLTRDHLRTSGAAGYYYENGELVSAHGNGMFGGLLVLDSQDRTVMFIDNTSGARIEDGCSFNLQCPPVSYDDKTTGGMILEVK